MKIELTHTECLRRGTEGAIKCRDDGSPSRYVGLSAKVHVDACSIATQLIWFERHQGQAH
jgi:hypothetical protein